MRLIVAVFLVATACSPVGRGSPPASVTRSTPEATDTSSCVAALDSLQMLFRRDYPGYRDKVSGRENELAALVDTVRAIAKTSDHHNVCIPALWRFTGFFRDPHIMLWQAAPPRETSSTSSQGIEAGRAATEDTLRPALRLADDSTAVLRLPSFDWAYQPAIDSLISANHVSLLATAYLIIDVRGNLGGSARSYAAIRPLLYTNPIHLDGMDVWASEGNMVLYRSWLTDPVVPEATKARARAVLPKLEASPNRLVEWSPDTVIRLDSVYPLPRKIAVVVDGKCASSCEAFVLEARQGRKVTVVGAENTGGMLDYGNVRSVWLPGWRRLRIPTSRARRLPEHPLDNIGIVPEVRVPEREPDAVVFALRYLRSTDGAPRR